MNQTPVSAEFTGACLCGAIQFRIRAPLAPIQVCYCRQCRKAQGGPLATNIPVDRSAFEIVAGAHVLRGFESSVGKIRHFCSRCGSPVYSERAALPQVVRVRAGLIDGALPVRAGSQAFVEARANWWPSDAALAAAPPAGG
jgi:hypothetical protein